MKVKIDATETELFRALFYATSGGDAVWGRIFIWGALGVEPKRCVPRFMSPTGDAGDGDHRRTSRCTALPK